MPSLELHAKAAAHPATLPIYASLTEGLQSWQKGAPDERILNDRACPCQTSRTGRLRRRRRAMPAVVAPGDPFDAVVLDALLPTIAGTAARSSCRRDRTVRS